ncbi:hypothetical protein Taro_032161 [Colocasia esculenta]|uniref:Uncharacterized protein n=1 Tax=Colocasia esculenta TaxID=4460 RepID=A0A843W140_COLES|nr:hypothetical protein [Colocasia esculenta]
MLRKRDIKGDRSSSMIPSTNRLFLTPILFLFSKYTARGSSRRTGKVVTCHRAGEASSSQRASRVPSTVHAAVSMATSGSTSNSQTEQRLRPKSNDMGRNMGPMLMQVRRISQMMEAYKSSWKIYGCTSLYKHKDGLRQLFLSSDWKNSAWAKVEDKRAANIIQEIDSHLYAVKIHSRRQHRVPLTPIGGNHFDAKFFRMAPFLQNISTSCCLCGDDKEDKDDEDLNHLFKKCTFARELNGGSLWSGDAPDLRQVAMHIPGLCCSTSECERNRSTFKHIHTKKRNHLEQKKNLNNLEYQYNQRLKKKFYTMKENPRNMDPLVIDELDPTCEWLVHRPDLDQENHIFEGEDLTWASANGRPRNIIK